MTIALLDYWCQTLGDDPPIGDLSGERKPEAIHPQMLIAAASDEHRARMARLQAGDVAELERVFRELAGPLCRFAERVGVTDAEADDIVSEVFLVLWQRRASLDTVAQLRPYLYSAVRHRALNVRRSAQRAVVREAAAVRALEDAAQRRAPEQVLEHDEMAAQVWREVHALPEAQQTAMTLRFAHELPLAEVASVLGVSTPAVKMLLQRAIRTLRERLDGVFEGL